MLGGYVPLEHVSEFERLSGRNPRPDQRLEAVVKIKGAKVYKGIAYFQAPEDASAVLRQLKPDWPHAHTVEYERGTAIQYYDSGAYYPEVPDSKSKYNPANWKQKARSETDDSDRGHADIR
jgi:hypothetical protein